MGRNSIAGQFAPRTIEMLESPAYRVLSLSAHRALDRLEIELAHHGGKDNGKLPCTFADFEAYGMDRHAIAPALRELVALGFLEVTERGTAGNREFRSPSLYRITYRHFGRLPHPTDEWKRVKSVEDATVIARVARRSEKQKTSGGFYQTSVGETHTETEKCPVGKTPTTVPVG